MKSASKAHQPTEASLGRAAKSEAWNAVGLDFWWLGRRSAKPNSSTLRWFTDQLVANSSCLVVGGTSVGLIRAAATRTEGVHVFDFSRRICDGLPPLVPSNVRIVCADVLSPPVEFNGRFDSVLSDTLLNRFDEKEARLFSRTAARLLKMGGILKTTVKLGLYPMDNRLLEAARMSGSTADFWDPESRIMDYRKVGVLLSASLVPHGGIGHAKLIKWYSMRGREKRFRIEDLKKLFGSPPWCALGIRADQDASNADRARLDARRCS